ncbi:hypothetical protein FBY33_2787 [Arthrobacter sp. SLBN-112]|jgi:hypothetical protein|nr:hypothetical protein FBY33_2787 [Arthrobacter sp. SLBN-112]
MRLRSEIADEGSPHRDQGPRPRGANSPPTQKDMRDVPLQKLDRSAVLALQRSAGNAAVASLVRPRRSGADYAAALGRGFVPVVARVPSAGAAPVIQRDSRSLPPGAQIVASTQTTFSAAPVLRKLNQLARSLWPPAVEFGTTRVANDIVAVMESSNLAGRSIPIQYTQTSGKNMIWTGNIFFGIGAPSIASRGTGQLTSGAGGTSSAQSGTSRSTTDTSSGELSAGGHEGAVGGKASAGTSSTAGSSSQDTTTGQSTASAQTSDLLNRYTAPLIATIHLHCELEVEVSDYANPFAWGMYLAETLHGEQDAHGDIACGDITYQVSSGFAPPHP